MNESDLENELRALRPNPPSGELEQKISRALQGATKESVATVVSRHAEGARQRFAWFTERLAWSLGGACALWVLQLAMPRDHEPSAAQSASKENVADAAPMTEQPVAIHDEGVTFLDSGVPARLVRYLTMEHHPLADGAEMRMPREDVIVLPVKMQ